jgi:hypothetical protein
MMCWQTVVLPDDSGPKISVIRPRGMPPTPRARSSAMEPVGMAVDLLPLGRAELHDRAATELLLDREDGRIHGLPRSGDRPSPRVACVGVFSPEIAIRHAPDPCPADATGAEPIWPAPVSPLGLLLDLPWLARLPDELRRLCGGSAERLELGLRLLSLGFFFFLRGGRSLEPIDPRLRVH